MPAATLTRRMPHYRLSPDNVGGQAIVRCGRFVCFLALLEGMPMPAATLTQRIKAHFFICFIALLILKVMQKQLGAQYPAGQIRKALSEMNLVKLDGFGYIPAFNNTPLTEALQEQAKMHINRQINTPAQLRADYRAARKC